MTAATDRGRQPFGSDAAEEFQDRGWRFLCSGEKLPGGGFHAVVRCRMPPDGDIRTLRLGPERFELATAACSHAKILAAQWVDAHLKTGRAP